MTVRILTGDCRALLATLDAESVQCCVCSPPYFGLRDYGVTGQIGLEATPDEYVAELVSVFREVRRALRDDGTLWLNLGDSYAGSGRGAGDTSSDNRGNIASRPDRGSKLAAGMHERVRVAGGIGRAWTRPPRGLKSKDLIGIPWRVAFALQADGWYLRQDIIWSKPNPMPESVTDRPTKAHEYLFLLSKSARYYYDSESVREAAAESSVARLSKAVARKRGIPPRHAQYPESSDQSGLDTVGRGMGRNRRSVWTVATRPFKDAHFATMPPALIEPCILAGSRPGDLVLDPFGGAGTTGLVADRLGRDALLIELNPEYAAMARARIDRDAPLFSSDGAA